MNNDKESFLLDTRDVTWPESPSLNAVPYPVPTGPPSIAWQRNDYAQAIYNTNSIPTTNNTGKVLPGPALKTTT
jgi:hypothetical protein